jgi:hypothetical protein
MAKNGNGINKKKKLPIGNYYLSNLPKKNLILKKCIYIFICSFDGSGFNIRVYMTNKAIKGKKLK